jgi:hypothetical protein
MSTPGSSADALPDALALTEARLRGDAAALTCLLDAGDNRAQASMLAGFCARFLTAYCRDPLAGLAALRPVLMGAGEIS